MLYVLGISRFWPGRRKALPQILWPLNYICRYLHRAEIHMALVWRNYIYTSLASYIYREDARSGAGGACASPKFQNLLNRPFKIQVERYMVLQYLPL